MADLMPTAVIQEFVDNFTPELAADIATQLSCSEVEALASLLLTAGHPELSEAWITAHKATPDTDCDTRH